MTSIKFRLTSKMLRSFIDRTNQNERCQIHKSRSQISSRCKLGSPSFPFTSPYKALGHESKCHSAQSRQPRHPGKPTPENDCSILFMLCGVGGRRYISPNLLTVALHNSLTESNVVDSRRRNVLSRRQGRDIQYTALLQTLLRAETDPFSRTICSQPGAQHFTVWTDCRKDSSNESFDIRNRCWK